VSRLSRRLASLGAICVWGCTAAAPPSSEPPAASVEVSVTPIPVDGSYGGLEEPMRTLVRSGGEWRDLWARLATDRIPRPTAPAIDFSERVVVVAAMGTRPTGGHAIRIDRVSYAGDTLWVEVTSVTPGAGCMTTQALTAPVAAVSVERRPNVSARFLDREETLECE
jgi:hypothetical protein